MTVGEVMSMIPGTILELPKAADAELDLLVNNKVMGSGRAVKVGENFGIRISFVGDVRTRLKVLGPGLEAPGSSDACGMPAAEPETSSDGADAELAALAEKMLSGQM